MCFRYKFFLGSGLGATFMNIGDHDGMGEDHCELVGGSENNGVPAEYNSTPLVYSKYIYEGWSEIIEIFILLFPWKKDKPLKIHQKVNQDAVYCCEMFLVHGIIRSILVS